MLIADGGGGGTTWNSMSMDEMQRLIQNPDIEKHYDLVSGWQKSAELVNSHRFQVQSYRDNLAAAWPPKKSAASAAYLLRLDELIGHLTETYNAALANHDALAAATLSLSLAQHDVQKLYDEYQANQTLLQTFEAKKQEAAGPTPHPTPNPGGDEPPVAAGRQEELRQRAAVLLGGVSTDLAQAQMSLVRPTPYSGAYKEEDKALNNGQSFVAPPIPPISSGSPAEDGDSRSNRPPTTLPTDVSTTQPPTGGTQQPGLVLGGTGTSATTPRPSVSPPTPPGVLPGGLGASTTPGSVPPGVSVFPGTPFVPPPGATVPGREGGIPRESPGRPVGLPPGGANTLPPGGVIGALPGPGLNQPAGRPAVRRINPVGGVIGGDSARGSTSAIRVTPVGEHASNFVGPYGQPGNRKTGNGEKADTSHWDPDNPWVTAEGVDPVVLPPGNQRIDPGPAIGLD
jgi:hypothetical protein